MTAFRILTGATSVLLGALLVWGSLHQSSDPTVLGRYSVPYAAGLALMSVALGWLVVAFARPQSRPAAWLRNAYLVLFATLLPLAAVEVGLRVFDPWGVSMFEHLPYHMQGMVDHPRLGYEHPKSVEYALGHNVVRLNAHGLRMDETVPFDKRPGERRILALGDSTTFGWGVGQGETFSDSLQRRLRASAQEQWTVINSGVNGYNTEQEVEYFFLTGRRYQPDIVILMFNANDVEPRIVPNRTTWRRYPSWPESLPELADRVRQMSYVYQLPMLLAKAQMMDLARKSGACATSVVDDPGWPNVATALARLRDACAESGIHLLVTMQSGDNRRSRRPSRPWASTC